MMTEQFKATKAKQGRSGNQVLKVLIAGLVLAIIAWAAADYFQAPPPDSRIITQPENGTPVTN